MPWHVAKSEQCPAGEPWAVVKDADGEIAGCHATEAAAEDQVAALYASEEENKRMSENKQTATEIVRDILQELFGPLFKRRQWDGSPSRWPSTESYCNSCLINVNQESGRTDPADWVQDHCMLPISNPGSDTSDPEALGPAAGRFDQVERPDDVSTEDFEAAKKTAANKLIAAYNEHDRTAPEGIYTAAGKEPPENREAGTRAVSSMMIYDQAWAQIAEMESWAWLMDVYHEDGGDLYALVTMDGKLYRAALDVSGDEVTVQDQDQWVQVSEQHPPIAARTKIRQQEDGRYRWFSVSAASVLNRCAEIDSRDLFDSMIAHAEETGEYPVRDFYHGEAQFRTGQADLLIREENLLVTSGLYDDTEIARREIAARQAEPDYWGDSIQYLPTEPPEMVEVVAGVSVPVYRAGILQYISTLPEADAASMYTVGKVRQEVTRMKGKQLEAFVKLFDGDEEAAEAWLSENVDETNRAILAGGQITRAGDGDAEPAGEPETPPEADPDPQEPRERTIELDDEALEAIVSAAVGAVLASPEIQALAQRQETADEALRGLGARMDETERTVTQRAGEVENRLVALEADEDEQRQRWQEDLGRRSPHRPDVLRVTHRPRQAKLKPNGPAGGGSLADTAETTLSNMPQY